VEISVIDNKMNDKIGDENIHCVWKIIMIDDEMNDEIHSLINIY
jgi:hypothetical protein